jgi:hypothetical protein
MIGNVYRTVAATCLVSSLALLPRAAQALDLNPSIGVGFELTTGDYGTDTDTTALFIPFTLALQPSENWGVSLEIPYVYQNNTNVIASQASPRGSTIRSAQLTAAMRDRAGNSMAGMQSTANTDPSESRWGLGDISLRVAYNLIHETESIPLIRPSVTVKFPTADESHGLGTGEFDEEIAVEFAKWLGDWTLFVQPGYTFQRNSPDIPLKDYWTLNGGLGYQLTDRFQPMVMLKSAGAPVEGAGSLLEARLRLKYLATQRTGIEGYLAKGLTTSTADYGTGLAIYYDF